jgi:hypothetical protein
MDAADRAECEERQLLEVEALAGLYADGGGAESCSPEGGGGGRDVHVAAPLPLGAGVAAVSFRLPALYPLPGHPALLARVAAPSNSGLAAEAARQALAEGAEGGTEALYEAVEAVRGAVTTGLEELGGGATDGLGPLPPPQTLPPPAAAEPPPAAPEGLQHGEPFVEKKSTFQAHAAPVASAAEVRAVADFLLLDNKVRRASHNMMAYRVASGSGGVAEDFDDDGENAAGGRLLHLLQAMDARGVVVVVSRWYGGVKLGPARFTHINNAARLLLEEMGYAQMLDKNLW